MSTLPEPAASPDPGVPQTADKAKVGLIVAAVLTVVALMLAFYFDGKNGTNFGEFLISMLGAAGVAVPTGLSVYKTKNRRKHPHKNRKG